MLLIPLVEVVVVVTVVMVVMVRQVEMAEDMIVVEAVDQDILMDLLAL